MPQRITVNRERTIKSFGVYSYFGGWVAITGCKNMCIVHGNLSRGSGYSYAISECLTINTAPPGAI